MPNFIIQHNETKENPNYELNKLMSIIADGLSNGTIQMDEAVREEILDWYVSQPSFIRLICGKQLLETGLLTSADHKYGEMSTVA